jgi:hypothetical protein
MQPVAEERRAMFTTPLVALAVVLETKKELEKLKK